MDKTKHLFATFTLILILAVIIILITYEAVHNSISGVLFSAGVFLFPSMVIIIWRFIQAKRNDDETHTGIIITSVFVMGYIAVLYWLYADIHRLIWYGIAFWSLLAIALIILLPKKYRNGILTRIGIKKNTTVNNSINNEPQANNTKSKFDYSNVDLDKYQTPISWDRDLDKEVKHQKDSVSSEARKQEFRQNYYQTPNNYQSDTSENSLISYIKQFSPRWTQRNGKHRLEGGENGNNANLAQHLRDCGISNVETEMTLNNGSRVDLLINGNIAIECKPHLLSVEKLHDVSGQIRRIKRLGQYEAYAVIFGNAKRNLLEDLKADIGDDIIILLGNIIET
jgi:hypothetical protein